MTDKELRQYQSLTREISNQEKRIETLREKDVPVVAGKVKASSKGHPYTEIRVGVQMHDPVIMSEIDRLIWQKQKRIEYCCKLVHMIENFIAEIEDSELRQIFEYRYIDGMKLREIGDKMSTDYTCISRKIRAYLNLQQKQQNP